jgi:uncharacterized OB-fold protein
MTDLHPRRRAAVPYLVVEDDGAWELRGTRCLKCGAVFARVQKICARCHERKALEAASLSRQGHLYTFTIVHRSYPGVPTPFIEAVVDLEGGGTLRGALTDIAADPGVIRYGLPVEVVCRDTGQRDETGASYVVPMFVPKRTDRGRAA